jgi:serine/threonine-protein kinase
MEDSVKRQTGSAPTQLASAEEVPARSSNGDVAIPVDFERSGSTPPPPAKVDPYLGKTIDGRYLVEAQLGEGGMGVVYRGKHKVIDKKVAIKVLRGDMAKDKEITERFLQEAKAASSIGNPHIVDISDFGTLPDGATYFVMEFLAGQSLGALMESVHPLPVPRFLRVARQIAAGLGAAHDAGIIHRDLKPDNVMLVDRGSEKDFVKILDFGIAKVGGEASRLTRAGAVFGTPHYMSPEQAAGTPVDKRTDIYALGVIMYEMASGKVPFDADNFMGILTQHMYKKPPYIRDLVPMIDIPPGVDAVIQKCLSKKPDGRYASMGDLVTELDKIEKGLQPDALEEMMARSGGFNVPADYYRPSAMPVPVPATPAGVPKSTRTPLFVAIGGVLTIALAAFAVEFTGLLNGNAQSNKNTGLVSPPPLAPPTTAAATATSPTAPSAATAPAATNIPPVDTSAAAAAEVVVRTEPVTAKIKVDDKEVDNLVRIKPGASVVIVVSASGYKDKTVTLDGLDLRPVVTLERKGGGSHPSPPTTQTAQQPPPVSHPSLGGVDSDPWANDNTSNKKK